MLSEEVCEMKPCLIQLQLCIEAGRHRRSSRPGGSNQMSDWLLLRRAPETGDAVKVDLFTVTGRPVRCGVSVHRPGFEFG